jgi:hypothetical protein
MTLRDFDKQILPHGICEYSVRRHDYMRLDFNASQASRLALSLHQYEGLRDARLDLVPRSILAALQTCVDAGAHAGSWTQTRLTSSNQNAPLRRFRLAKTCCAIWLRKGKDNGRTGERRS